MSIKTPTILPKEITDKYDIIRETFVRKDKGEKNEEREIEIGDIHSDDFQPQVKLKQWDNETNFSVRLIDDEPTEPRIEIEGNKIKFIKKKTEVHFYEEGDNFKFVPILKEKPLTNKIEMSMRSKGLKFYYQPELTQKEIDDGAFRPEHIVGSWAVYHSTKQGDYSLMGLKNYRAGKAFHIYRPRLKDSNGWEVWGDLFIDAENGIYRITIPADFYENAVYPIMSNDTFGYYNGGTPGETSFFLSGGNNFDVIAGTALEVADIDAVVAYGTGNTNVKGLIWLKTETMRGTLLTNGITPVLPINVTTEWVTASYSNKPSVTATNYYIGITFEGSFTAYYDSGNSGDGGYESFWTSDYDNPGAMDSNWNFNTYRVSIYATYTTGVGYTSPLPAFRRPT